MAMDEIVKKATELLAIMAFTDKASRLLVALIANGQCILDENRKIIRLNNAQDCSGEIDLLCASGLIIEECTCDGSLLVPLHPSIVCRSIYSNYMWRFIPNEKYLYSLSNAAKIELMAFKQMCTQLEAYLLEIYNPISIEHDLVPVIKNNESQALAQAISKTKNILRGITAAPWLPNIGVIWPAIKTNLEKGMQYFRLTDLNTIIAFGLRFNIRDTMKYGINLRIADDLLLKEKYFIIDQKEVFVIDIKPNGTQNEIQVTRVGVTQIVESFISGFDAIWEKSPSAQKAISFIKNVRNKFCDDADNIGSDAKVVAQGIFDFGIYYQPQYDAISDKRYNKACSQLLDNKLACFSSQGDLRIVPNIQELVANALAKGQD